MKSALVFLLGSLLFSAASLEVEPFSEDLAFNLTMVAGSAYCDIDKIVQDFQNKTLPDGTPDDISITVGGNLHAMGYHYFDSIQRYVNIFNSEIKVVLYINNDKKEFVVSFEGTRGQILLVQELIESYATPFDLHPIKNAYVNAFAIRHYNETFRVKLTNILSRLREEYRDYRLIFTGHSLGGSLATIAALDGVLLGLIDKNNLLLYTFGQPRTGNYEFTRAVEEHIQTSYRIVHYQDIVPHIPPCPLSGCRKANGSKSFFQINNEVWYHTKDMVKNSYHICQDEDVTCANRFTIFGSSFFDHLYYFGIRIGCGQQAVFPEDADVELKEALLGLFTVEELFSY